METRRLVSVMIACIAAILVMWSGKSCAEDIQKKNRKSNGGSGVYSENYGNGLGSGYEAFTDSENNTSENVQEAAVTTAAPYEVQTITNLLGDVVGTVTITTTATEQIQVETTTVSKSILESYNDKKTFAAAGNQSDNSQTTVTTVTFQTIDPDDIVLNVG